MNWKNGYNASYHMTIVDRDTWRDVGRIELLDGTIKHSDSELRESADLTCANYRETNEQIVRVWLDAVQNGSASHTPLFTGYATSPSRQIEGRLITSPIQCYSILKPAQDILLARGWYAPAEIAGGSLIKELLKVTKAPVEISENSPSLQQAIIAESGETNLTMVDKILTAIDWRLKIYGDGRIFVGPKATEPSTSFDNLDNDILEQTLTISYDWYDTPNVFRAIFDNVSAIARDDSPDSRFSTVNRRREIWAEESDCNLNDGESISAYASRRLKELQKVAIGVSYTRRFEPDVLVSDIARINYPGIELVGDFEIISQSITLGPNAKTSEEVVQV